MASTKIDQKIASFLTMASHGNHISDMSGIRYLEVPEFLKKLRPCVNNDTILGLYYSFIYPYSTYCVHVWGKTYRSNLDCIITLQKRVIRILAGVHPLTHTEPIFSRLKILKFFDLVDYIIGIYMYKVYHRDVPNIFETHYTLRTATSMIMTPGKSIIYILPMLIQTDAICLCGFREAKSGILL